MKRIKKILRKNVTFNVSYGRTYFHKKNLLKINLQKMCYCIICINSYLKCLDVIMMILNSSFQLEIIGIFIVNSCPDDLIWDKLSYIYI